ncbi:PPC domain-containing DNA-binding protein [Zoogloea sp.]|uniref:PPC domain-containing DNA-binding protein n=1 Tax=Zoogloea sp. TaxID=49181 RepID=UPI002630732C|nr:PPC domain-containing DNA-binding protein [Zoogloea sp.]MDD3352286.1 DNA-binding protein [Zoogloea sp.]
MATLTGVPLDGGLMLRPLRLTPGQDLRRALECAVFAEGLSAAFVLSGLGSLQAVSLRFAGASEATILSGKLELLGLAGSLSADGAHLHGSVADDMGQVSGGHLGYGCIVRTTAEVLLALLPDWDFRRATDPGTGHAELVVRRRS